MKDQLKHRFKNDLIQNIPGFMFPAGGRGESGGVPGGVAGVGVLRPGAVGC